MIGVVTVLLLVLHAPLYRAAMGAGLCIFLAIGLLASVKGWNIKGVTHYFLIVVYTFLTMYISGAGGIKAPSAIWLIILPLVAFLTLSTRYAWYWLMIVLTTLAAFHFFSEYTVLGRL